MKKIYLKQCDTCQKMFDRHVECHYSPFGEDDERVCCSPDCFDKFIDKESHPSNPFVWDYENERLLYI